MSQEVKLLIFDWDGTLCDSVSRIVSCVREAALAVGLEPPDPEAAQEIIGLGLVEALEALFPDIELPEILAMRDNYAKHFVSKDVEPSPFFPGVEQTLQRLRDQGYWLTVATGKSRRGLDRVLENRGLMGFFHASRCADETASKPHPLMLEELLSEFSVSPEQALMVGDTEFDMEMAFRAGVPRIAVSYGAHAIERLTQYQPVLCVDEFKQIENYLKIK